MEKIKDLNKFFTIKNDKLIFSGGKELIIRIPKRYEVYGLLDIQDTINTLAVLGIEIDNKYMCGLKLLGMFEIPTKEYEEEVINNIAYIKIILEKDDIVFNSIKTIKNSSITYAIFVEFMTYGKWPYFIDYDSACTILERANLDTGMSLNVNRIVYEFIIAHLARDADDVNVFYRHTNKKKPPNLLMLRSVSHATESTTSKVLGSYFNDGLVSSLVHEPPNDSNYEIEDMLRL
jgi:hypothetical protein